MRTITLPNETLLPEVAEMLLEGNIITIKAKGNSMLPFIIGNRDSVILRRRDIFTVGDIVLAEVAPEYFVLHRIIRIKNINITLMGDGNLSGTEVCGKENIHGYAVSIIRKGKQINCNSKVEQFKTRIWQILLPFRRYLLAIYRRTIM